MRRLLTALAAAMLLTGGMGLSGAAEKKPASKKSASKKAATSPKRASSTARKASAKRRPAARSSGKSAASAKKVRRRGKASASSRSRRRQTWRNRQLAPTKERYQEIQQALIGKGYLNGEATGVWDQNSIDALRRFQADQKLDPSGKLDSLSLIALGLGPKHDTVATAPPAPKPSQP